MVHLAPITVDHAIEERSKTIWKRNLIDIRPYRYLYHTLILYTIQVGIPFRRADRRRAHCGIHSLPQRPNIDDCETHIKYYRNDINHIILCFRLAEKPQTRIEVTRVRRSYISRCRKGVVGWCDCKRGRGPRDIRFAVEKKHCYYTSSLMDVITYNFKFIFV